MDLQIQGVSLGAVFEAALSTNPDERKAAEEKLQQLQYLPGYLVSLMQFIVRADVVPSARQMASITFKNLVTRDWEQDDDKPDLFPIADKTMVRASLMDAMILAPPSIRSQLEECLKAIARTDYPKHWPQLLTLIDSHLKSNDQQKTFGGLLALRILTRKYEFKDEEERIHLQFLVRTTFPLVLEIFKYLLSVPNPSLEIADLIKIICKVFASSTYLDIPEALQEEQVFVEWMGCFYNLVQRPVPIENQPQDLDLRKTFPWWKVKKWTLAVINRLYNRFGDPKMFKGKLKKFTMMFRNCGVIPKFLEAYLSLLSGLREGSYLPDRITNLALQFVTASVARVEYSLLKPHLPILLYEIVFPMMCFNDEDDRLWREDPQEYVRKGYDIFEDMYSPRTAATSFLVELIRKRNKDVLETFIAFLVAILDRYENAPPEHKLYRQKDGAMMALSAIAFKLKKAEPYKSQIESVLVRHVFPEFNSPMPHLRARAAWVSGHFAGITFSNRNNLVGVVNAVANGLKDPHLPVRVDSIVAFKSFVEIAIDLDLLRPMLPTLLDDTFKLMNEVDTDELVLTLETIVEKFGEEIAPYAYGLITNLAQAFWKFVKTDEEADEGSDTATIAAAGCLRAICTILESISSLPDLYPQLEPCLLPIMKHLLAEDGSEYDLFEEAVEIVSFYTYYSPSISPQVWTVWPLLVHAVGDYGIDFFENALGPLDNFVARGTDHFLGSAECKQSLFELLKRVLSDDNLEDRDVQAAPKLMESVLQNCRGRVDEWIEPYLRLAIARYNKTEGHYLQDLLIGVIANAIYYNPALTLNVLKELSCLPHVFQVWLQMIYKHRKGGKAVHFRREHDKKVCVLALSSIIAFPPSALPQEINAGMAEVIKASLKLLSALKEQQDANAKAEEEDEEDEEDNIELEDDDDDDEAEDDEATAGSGEAYAAQASKWLKENEGQVGDHGDDDDDDTASDFTDDEEYRCPIDEVDPFLHFGGAVNALMQADPARLQSILGSLDFQHQAYAHGVNQHSDELKRKQQLGPSSTSGSSSNLQ